MRQSTCYIGWLPKEVYFLGFAASAALGLTSVSLRKNFLPGVEPGMLKKKIVRGLRTILVLYGPAPDR